MKYSPVLGLFDFGSQLLCSLSILATVPDYWLSALGLAFIVHQEEALLQQSKLVPPPMLMATL